MRNRWFHTPELHSPVLNEEKKVTWLELFYDLIFVAAFIQLGNGLSHHVSVEGFFAFAAIFVPLWVAWTGFTFYVNRFNVDDIPHRLVVIIQMFAVGAMAIGAPHIFDGHSRTFVIAYAAAQGLISLLYLRSSIQVPEARPYCRYWGAVFGIGAVLWLISIPFPAPACYVLWAIGVCVIFAAPLSSRSRALQEQFPTDQEHLGERYGLLTLIVLGESFVKVLGNLAGEGAGITVLLQAGVLLLLTVCIWWIYFDDVAGSRIRGRRFMPIIWLYAHLPLQIGITATGVAIKKAVAWDMAMPAGDGSRWLLASALGLTLLSVSVIDSVTERQQAELSDKARVTARFGAAVLILLLAPAGSAMTAGVFLALITAVCLAQVIFDMMMAPFEAMSDHDTAKATPIAEIAHRQLEGDEPAGQRLRRDLGDAVRRGTPATVRDDLFFYFMDGGWVRYLFSLAFLYVIGNVLFAALYVLQPGCIENGRASSFSDAFFFSVQTMSTLGYGVMSPATTYGNVIVTIEAAVGLLGVALATGLTFAKVSRPQARVLFSNGIALTHYGGQKVLMFRVGNARGNEIVDASVNVSVARDEISPEGQHMRRMYDLRLLRSRSPLFMLSWSVIHPLDEDSPLKDMDWDHPEKSFYSIIATLSGFDGTYAQTVHSRHLYEPADVESRQHFVDILSELPDGRMMVDYTRFHETEADK